MRSSEELLAVNLIKNFVLSLIASTSFNSWAAETDVKNRIMEIIDISALISLSCMSEKPLPIFLKRLAPNNLVYVLRISPFCVKGNLDGKIS